MPTRHATIACVTPPYVAQLRVYEPLVAFPAEERRHWEEYLRSGRAPYRLDGPVLERAVGLKVAIAPQARVPREGEVSEHAYVAYVDSVPLVCPWRIAVRCWQAATDLPVVLPDGLAVCMLPGTEIATAASSLARWSLENPRLHTHILTSRWMVPAQWFVLFDREERRLRLGSRSDAGRQAVEATTERSLMYVTEMPAARRRVARALAVLRKVIEDGSVIASVQEIGRWLEEFHPRSVVELDYGGLVHLLGDEDLRTDDSAGDVAESVVALGRGDIEGATAAYDRVIARWRTAQLVESAN